MSRIDPLHLLGADLLDLASGATQVGERTRRGRARVQKAAEIDPPLARDLAEVELDPLLPAGDLREDGRAHVEHRARDDGVDLEVAPAGADGHRQLSGALRAGVEDAGSTTLDARAANREVGLDAADLRRLRRRERDLVAAFSPAAAAGEDERQDEHEKRAP